MSEAPSALVDVLAPVVADLGLSLYDVELVGARGRARTVRVLVAAPDGAGGIGLDEIAAATESVSPALDRAAADPATGVARILPGAYTLEVSSPGLERPLRTPEHWRGAMGVTVSVRTNHADEVLRRRGVVRAVDDGGAELEIDGARERLAFADVVQARTVFEWGSAPKPGGSKARTRRANQKVKR